MAKSVLIIVLSGLVLSISGGEKGLPKEMRKSLINGNSAYMVEIERGVVPESKQLPGKSYFKGFEVVNQFEVSDDDLRQLKLTLLSDESYNYGGVRSCYFSPDFAMKITSDVQDQDPFILLASSGCEKIFVSTTNDYFTGKGGKFLDMSDEGFEAIKNIYTNLIEPFSEFDNYKENSSETPYEQFLWRQLGLFESLLKEGKVRDLEQLEQNNTFLIFDSLSFRGSSLKKVNILIQKDQGFTHDKFRELIEPKQLKILNGLMQENIVKTMYAPMAAGVIDGVPDPDSSPQEIAEYYLSRIEQLLNANEKIRKKWTLQGYLSHEESKAAGVADKIKMRKKFLKFLKGKL